MICIESPKQTDQRIDSMLREMVVEEALAAFEEEEIRGVILCKRSQTLVGWVLETMRRIEKAALSNLKKIMLQLKINE